MKVFINKINKCESFFKTNIKDGQQCRRSCLSLLHVPKDKRSRHVLNPGLATLGEKKIKYFV